jgi:epoxyqueuosine reductase QueG
MITKEILEASLLEAGIEHFGCLSRGSLREACSGMEAGAAARYGVEGSGGAIAVALPYGEGPAACLAWAAAYPGPLARIARFARANWYSELGHRLKDAASRIRSRLSELGVDPGPSKKWRYFTNSRLPERRLALASGIGSLGRNGLVMIPDHGSAAVLGVLLLPLAVESSFPPGRVTDEACEGCGACVAACPTGALAETGQGLPHFIRERCLQHWSSIPGPLPPDIEAAWGDALYGCDICQEACPRFKPEASAETRRGVLGPGLPASWLAAASEPDIASVLRGSALGMGWISKVALRRNAVLVLREGKPSSSI